MIIMRRYAITSVGTRIGVYEQYMLIDPTLIDGVMVDWSWLLVDEANPAFRLNCDLTSRGLHQELTRKRRFWSAMHTDVDLDVMHHRADALKAHYAIHNTYLLSKGRRDIEVVDVTRLLSDDLIRD